MKKEKQVEEIKAEKVRSKRTYTLKFYMMIISGASTIIGTGMFILYFFSLNKIIGVPGIFMAIAGVFVFNYYWKKEESIAVDHLDGIKRKHTSNSLCIYPSKVVFEDVYQPSGFPWTCENDGKKYYVNIQESLEKKNLVPFILPDQQYCPPEYLAQRVLGLPAHKKIFESKPKLIQKLKTMFLVLAIGIVWLLILTTTGG